MRRFNQPEIGKMAATIIWIVENVDIAISKTAIPRRLVDYRPDRKGHDTDKMGRPDFPCTSVSPFDAS